MRITAIVCGFALSLGCAHPYAPPEAGHERSAWDTTIDQPFAAVWSDLINHVSASSFSINHVERASGLVSLNFGAGASTLSRYVDCGRAGDLSLVDYLARGKWRTTLGGSLNIFVQPVSASKTQVRVTARYVVDAKPHRDSRSADRQFVFDTGQSAQDGQWVCKPTYKAEGSILSSVRASASSRNPRVKGQPPAKRR